MKPIHRQLRFIYILFSWVLIQIFICTGFCIEKSEAAKMIRIGLLEEPKTLNIWLASDRWSRKVLGQIYHPLYIRAPKTLKLIPWLAESDPVYDEAGLSYTIKLRSAKWSDGTEFTAEDVVFTGNLIKEFRIPRNYSKWKFIDRIEAVNEHTVRFILKKPKAIFLARTLTTPIVQKKEWEKVITEVRKAKKPLAMLLNYKMEKPVGMGPFVLKAWKQGAYLFLEKNKHFFGQGKKIGGYLLGPYIDGIIFKIFGTSDAAILAMKKGTVDMFWWGIQPGYLEDLKREKDIHIYTSKRSALYYLGFNVRKKPFNDVHFRQAVARLIDRDFIISRVLQGYGQKMNSIVPAGNSFWHCPDIPGYDRKQLSRSERIKMAYEILRKAGYTWKKPPVDADGNVGKGKGIKLPDGSSLKKFTILTPPADYDPHRAMAGLMIQEWLRRAGIPAASKPMAFGSLIQQIKGCHKFDMFILGYGKLSLDPDYLRSFFHSRNDKTRGWNMSGYHNPEYDRIAEESTGAMDVEKRRKLIWEMQRILMRDIPYLPLYNPKLIEGVRKDKFTGWVPMLEGIGNTWSFCMLEPK